MIYSDILLSMEDNVCFSIVDMARSNDHPQGFFRTEFKKLKEKFESTSQASRCEIKLEYENLKMKTQSFLSTLWRNYPEG